jgi:hypothetical protein
VEPGRGRRRAAGERQRWLDRSTKGIGLARGLGCFSFGEVAGRVERGLRIFLHANLEATEASTVEG